MFFVLFTARVVKGLQKKKKREEKKKEKMLRVLKLDFAMFELAKWNKIYDTILLFYSQHN